MTVGIKTKEWYSRIKNSDQDNAIISKWMKYSIIAVVIIVVISIVGIIIQNIVNTSNSLDFVEISNFEELPETPPKKLQNGLDSIISGLLAYKVGAEMNKTTSGIIRNDTSEFRSDNGIKSVRFIIDMDEYQQSYNVAMSWSDVEEVPQPVSVECTRREQSKYPDEKCYGMHYDSDSVNLYLPYEGELKSGNEFTAASGIIDSYGVQHITVTAHDCGDEMIREEAVEAVKDYIKKTGGLNPEQFVYSRVSDYGNCN